MLANIRKFFDTFLEPGTGTGGNQDDRHRQELAAAALMVELMATDQHFDERENRAFLEILSNTFDLAEAEVAALAALAREEAQQSTSLYQFTSLVNESYDYREKVLLVGNLWRLAYADGRLDRYEDHLIRKLAELIHVSHSDFIRMKHKARGQVD